MDVTQATIVLTVLSILLGVLLLIGSLGFFGFFVGRLYPAEAAAEEVTAEDRERRTRRAAAYRQGVMVIAGLAVLTGIEYLVAVAWPSTVILLLLGLFKAGLILNYFMHVARLWTEEAHA
jgi:hypothetical protein